MDRVLVIPGYEHLRFSVSDDAARSMQYWKSEKATRLADAGAQIQQLRERDAFFSKVKRERGERGGELMKRVRMRQTVGARAGAIAEADLEGERAAEGGASASDKAAVSRRSMWTAVGKALATAGPDAGRDPSESYARIHISAVSGDDENSGKEQELVRTAIITALRLRSRYVFKCSNYRRNGAAGGVPAGGAAVSNGTNATNKVAPEPDLAGPLSFGFVAGVARVQQKPPIVAPASYNEFVEDYANLVRLCFSPALVSFCRKRLDVLTQKFGLFTFLNQELEQEVARHQPGSDFYRVGKADLHCCADSSMTARELVAFMKKKFADNREDVVDGGETLGGVFASLGIKDSSDLTTRAEHFIKGGQDGVGAATSSNETEGFLGRERADKNLSKCFPSGFQTWCHYIHSVLMSVAISERFGKCLGIVGGK